MSRVFASGPGDQDSIPSRVIPKTQEMVHDAAWSLSDLTPSQHDLFTLLSDLLD